MSLQITKGDTPTIEFTITDDAGVAIDLTNISSIKFTAKSSLALADVDAIFEKTCAVVLPATDGICDVTLLAADTATVGNYIGELELRSTAGSIITSSRFILEIVGDVRTAA